MFGLDGVEDVFVLRKGARGLLGVDELSAHRYFEDTPAGADELGCDAESILDRCRQTDGTGFVVSNDAVFDADGEGFAHDAFPLLLPGTRL